jgi:MFS family permease
MDEKKLGPMFIALLLWSGTCIGIYSTAIMLQVIDLGATPMQIGMIRSLDMLGNMLVVLPAGLLIDRLGSRNVYFAGALLCGGVYLWLAKIPAVNAMFMAVWCVGAATALRFVSMNTEFLGKLQTLGKSKSGLLRASHLTGITFIGPVAGAQLYRIAGFTGVLILVSAAVAGSAVLSGKILSGRHPQASVGEPGHESIRVGMKTLLAHKKFLAGLMLEGVTAMAGACLGAFIIVIGIKNFGLAKETAVLFLSINGAMLISTLALGGHVFKNRHDLEV